MKNARRNISLAAVAALALAVAPSALADVRIRVNLPLPLPPPPGYVLRHLPAPPPPPVVDFGYRNRGYDRYGRERYDGRWVRYGRPDRGRYVWVEGRWVERPFAGAIWVTGFYDRRGAWVPGYWTRGDGR